MTEQKIGNSPVAWVIGASSGIGRAVAEALSEDGWKIVITGRRGAKLDSLAKQLDGSGDNVLPLPGDVSDPEEVQRLAATAHSWEEGLDAVIHCAGTNVSGRRWSDLTVSDFDCVADTNYKSVVYVVLTALPYLREKGGAIVVTSSWAGWRYLNRVGPSYGSSKSALGPLVESINAEEGPRGIRATLLAPGEVATDLIRNFQMPSDEQELLEMLQPEHTAEVVRYLLSLPPSVCINEIVMSPTRNRLYGEIA